MKPAQVINQIIELYRIKTRHERRVRIAWSVLFLIASLVGFYYSLPQA